jgi:hypothetical protein
MLRAEIRGRLKQKENEERRAQVLLSNHDDLKQRISMAVEGLGRLGEEMKNRSSAAVGKVNLDEGALRQVMDKVEDVKSDAKIQGKLVAAQLSRNESKIEELSLWRQQNLESKRSNDQYQRLMRAEQESKVKEIEIRLKVLQKQADEKFHELSRSSREVNSITAKLDLIQMRLSGLDGKQAAGSAITLEKAEALAKKASASEVKRMQTTLADMKSDLFSLIREMQVFNDMVATNFKMLKILEVDPQVSFQSPTKAASRLPSGRRSGRQSARIEQVMSEEEEASEDAAEGVLSASEAEGAASGREAESAGSGSDDDSGSGSGSGSGSSSATDDEEEAPPPPKTSGKRNSKASSKARSPKKAKGRR